jgi:tetratricopeptide (TPR) repeat protein
MRPRGKPAPRAARATSRHLPPAPPLLVAVIALAFALRLAASALPPRGLWGLDTLRHFPPAAVAGIVLLGLVGFVPPVAGAIERAFDRIGATWERMGAWADLGIAVATGFALFHLRDTVCFVGDFEVRLSEITRSRPDARILPQAFPLDWLINVAGARAVMTLGLEAELALQLVGAAVGGLFALASLGFVRAAGATRAMIPAAAAVILGGGYMLHFAGYDKFGPLLLGIGLAGYGAARLARDGGGAWALGAGAAVCVLSHRTGYAALPAVAVVLVQAWRAAAGSRARTWLAAVAAVVLAAALALAPRAIHLLDTLDRPVQGTLATESGRGPFAAWTRASDAANLLFLLVPLWLAGIVAAWLARGPAPLSGGAAPASARPPAPAPPRAPGTEPPSRRFSLAPGALVALAAAAALVLGTRGAQGASRDWDMHAGPAALVSLASTAALLAAWRWRGAARSLAPAFTTALAAAIALWGIHASPAIATARIQDTLADRAAWSDAAWARAHDFIGMQALRDHRPADAARALEQAVAVAPNARYLFELGLAERELGLAGRDSSHIARAVAAFERARRVNPASADAWVGLAMSAFDLRDYPRAIACADSALARDARREDATMVRTAAFGVLARRNAVSPGAGSGTMRP